MAVQPFLSTTEEVQNMQERFTAIHSGMNDLYEAHVQLSLLVHALLVLQQHLHGLHVLLVDGVQQGVLGLDLLKERKKK